MSGWLKSKRSKDSKLSPNLEAENFNLSPLASAVKVAIVSLGLTHGLAQAATIEVNSNLDDGTDCTLRDAITSVNNAGLEAGCINTGQAFGVDDIVNVAGALSNDTVVLQNGELEIINLVASSFTIDGNGVTVDANDESIVLNVDGVPGKLTINDITMTGGRAPGQPYFDRVSGMSLKNANVTINDSTVSGNVGGSGGITIESSAVTINDSMISGNRVSNGSGGGISVFNESDVVINNSTISDNLVNGDGFSVSAGGMSVTGFSLVDLNNSLIVNNRSEGTYANAGGILVDRARLRITDSSVSNNYLSGSTPEGGGIYFRGGGYNGGVSEYARLYVINSTVSGNTINASNGGSGGGAINIGSEGYSTAFIEIDSSTFSDNVADTNSGIVVTAGGLNVNNTTISGHPNGSISAYGDDAALFLDNSTISGTSVGTALNADSILFAIVNNSIIANSEGGNDCSYIPASSFRPGSRIGRLITDRASIIEDGSCSASRPDNNASRAVDPRLLPLSDNGCVKMHATLNGPACVMTHALSNSSPAINTGAFELNFGAERIDQIGTSRPQGAGSDVGAFELPIDSPNEPGFTVTATDAVEAIDTNVVFTITLDKPRPVKTAFDFHTVSGSAAEDSDYVGRFGRVFFPAGETVRERRVTILNDRSIAERDETFSLVVTDINDPLLSVAAEATIRDVSVEEGEPIIRVAMVRALEDRGIASVFVTLSRQSTKRIRVNFQTIVPSSQNNPATPGEDFVTRSGTIMFSPGVTRAVRNIILVDDGDIEANEVFRFELSDPVNAEIEQGSERQRVFILNDD